MIIKNIKEKQKGALAIYIAMITILISLTMVLGLTHIFLKHLRIVKGIGDSAIAFHAANAGMERLLYYRFKAIPQIGHPFKSGPYELPNGASYIIRFFECSETGREHLESIGLFKGARRAVRTSF
jgi:hypothetical protein